MTDMIEDLKGDNPKIFGYDYYNVIYATAWMLTGMMIVVYFTVDDEQLQKLVLGQGALSIGLILSIVYYRKRLEKQKIERL